MNFDSIFITILSAGVSGGIFGALGAAIIQTRSEKNSRIFNAKLEAYKEFIGHLKTGYSTLEEIDMFAIEKISAHCLLVSNITVKNKIDRYNRLIGEGYDLLENDADEKEVQELFYRKIFPLEEEIEDLMRKDLKIK